MGAAGSKASGTPLAKRLQKKVYNAATTLKRGSNSFFAKVRGVFTRKAAPPNTATRRAKAEKRVNMLERLNRSPKGLNWLRKGYYGVKKLFNKKSLKNRIASAKGKVRGLSPGLTRANNLLAAIRAADPKGANAENLFRVGPPSGTGSGFFTGTSNNFARALSAAAARRRGSRSGSGRSRAGSGYPGGKFN
jgi:hypothetical protein